MNTAIEPVSQIRKDDPARSRTAFLIFDTESVPDGRLLRDVKYPGERISEHEAIERAQREAREISWTGSDFLPAAFQFPVATAVVRVGADFALQSFKCLDAPHYRTPEIVRDFWVGINHYTSGTNRLKLVSFNGRGFDFPLMEMAAFRYGLAAPAYYQATRRRFDSHAIDLLDWFNNFGAIRHAGGVNLLAKLLGKPGKTAVAGDQVYRLWTEGKFREINDYCLCDALDTYFVFLRTCVMRGEITASEEHNLTAQARERIAADVLDCPALKEYLDNWTTAIPWP